MDSARKAEIRARLAAATPGPWDLRFNANGEGELFGDDHNTWIALLPHRCVARLEEQMHKDAAFIAAAPTDIADLLAALEEAESCSVRSGGDWRFPGRQERLEAALRNAQVLAKHYKERWRDAEANVQRSAQCEDHDEDKSWCGQCTMARRIRMSLDDNTEA